MRRCFHEQQGPGRLDEGQWSRGETGAFYAWTTGALQLWGQEGTQMGPDTSGVLKLGSNILGR